MAEVDDDVITWKNFKVFHTRNMNMDTMGGDGWNVMMWNERSLQDSAQNWSYSLESDGCSGSGCGIRAGGF